MRYADGDDEPSKGRKWLKIIGVILIVMVLGRVLGWGTGSLISKKSEPTPEELVSEAVATLKPQLPAKINEYTTVTDISASGKEIIQVMTVSRDLSDDDMVLVRRGDADQICSSPSHRKLIESGGAMRFIYQDSDGDKFESKVSTCET